MDIIEKIEDLKKQATLEKSHFYVASVLKESKQEILKLRKIIKKLIEE